MLRITSTMCCTIWFNIGDVVWTLDVVKTTGAGCMTKLIAKLIASSISAQCDVAHVTHMVTWFHGWRMVPM